MRHAPSVSYPTGRCAFWAGCWLVAWLLGALACLVWARAVLAAQQDVALAWGILLVPLVSGGWAWRGWRAQVPGRLAWTGQVWTWQTTDAPAPELVQLRTRQGWGGGHLLLELQGPGARRWVCACARRAPADWQALCRAVYSRADAVTQSGLPPP